MQIESTDDYRWAQIWDTNGHKLKTYTDWRKIERHTRYTSRGQGCKIKTFYIGKFIYIDTTFILAYLIFYTINDIFL